MPDYPFPGIHLKEDPKNYCFNYTTHLAFPSLHSVSLFLHRPPTLGGIAIFIGFILGMTLTILAGGFLLLPSYILSTKNRISADDPHQQIILFSNREMEPAKAKKINLNAVPVRANRIIREKIKRISFR